MADAPLDEIHIRGLQARCIVGVHPDERRKKQDVVIDLTLRADLRRPCATDDLRETVDYQAVAEQVLATVEESSCRLLERLAERIAEVCLAHDGVEQVRVRVEKPDALRSARSAGVEIARGTGGNA